MKFLGSCLTLFVLFLSSAEVGAQLTYNELKVSYDSIWTYKNLQLIPVRFKPRNEGPGFQTPGAGTITLAEALKKHKAKVREIKYKNGADVNTLEITNNSKQSLMVQSGDLLEGGKQDRMVGETKFIAPGITDYINVYCVEKRRWDKKPKEFKHRGSVNSDVKKAMDKTGRQSEVWREIDKQFLTSEKKSETLSYLHLYNNTSYSDTGYINYFTSKYYTDSNLAGFIFITGTEIMSTEIFASSHLLELSFANMLSSYVQTAVRKGSSPNVPIPTVKTFMDKVILNEETQKAYVPSHGKLHKEGDKVIHLLAYPD